MLVKIAELMEQTNDVEIFAALKCALIESCRTIERKFDSPESKYPKMLDEEILYGQNKGKIDAVREYKNRNNLSLMEAKRAVEYQFDRLGYKFKPIS